MSYVSLPFSLPYSFQSKNAFHAFSSSSIRTNLQSQLFCPNPSTHPPFFSLWKTSFNVTGRHTYPISASVVNPKCRERPTPFTFKSSYCPRISSAPPPRRSTQKPRRQWLCSYACRRATIIVTSSFPVLPRTMFGMLRDFYLPRFVGLPKRKGGFFGWALGKKMMQDNWNDGGKRN